jgi:hypothetical protein
MQFNCNHVDNSILNNKYGVAALNQESLIAVLGEIA